MADPTQQKRDLTLADLEYAFTQDVTTGKIKVYNGSTVVNPTAQEVLVKYDPKTGDYLRCNNPEDARCKAVGAEEGEYIVLRNPSKTEKYPASSTTQNADELENGRKVVLPGPKFFALWPGQSAEVIKGHHLRSNQYLMVRIYHEELAKKNWSTAIMRPATNTTPVLDADGKALDPQPVVSVSATPAVDLTIGKLHIIKGTEVSFFIPPSGVEVVKDDQGKYVRDALTLERMEYAILIDEDGNKRFERGPQVVFPEPSEAFQVKDGAKKQNAVELNSLQGLHLKAIADFDDKEHSIKFKAGEEYFVTGDDTRSSADEKIGAGSTIFYPREELAFVRYDGKTKIFAVTVPEGEGRYLMDRISGKIETVRGPKQLLPNPCKYVIVRRALSEKQSALWFPGNFEAMAYNQGIAGAASSTPTTRAGALSEGDFERATKGAMRKTLSADSAAVMRSAVSSYAGESSRVSGDQKVMGDEFERSSGYTAPRTLTLNTKYQGAVRLTVWTGYAVMVISEKSRRVVQGPQTILLDYDEDLEVLAFSTGKPKTTDNLLQTVYLQVENNKVSDVIEVETVEGVKAQVYVSYLVGFEGDSAKWFSVSNYIKLMCDRARSMLKGAVRKLGVENFYTNSTDIVRDTLLGKNVEGKRAGLLFTENGMRVRDIDVLNVQLLNPALAQKLSNAQLQVIDSNINLAAKRRELEQTREVERIEQETVKVQAETQKLKDSVDIELVKSSIEKLVAEADGELTKYGKQIIIAKSINEKEDFVAAAGLARAKAVADQDLALSQLSQNQKIEMLKAENAAVVAKLAALKDGYGEILGALSERDVLVKMTEAQNLLNLVHKDAKSEALVTSIIEMRQLKEVLNGATRGIIPAVMPAQPKA
jgi:major vault protein